MVAMDSKMLLAKNLMRVERDFPGIGKKWLKSPMMKRALGESFEVVDGMVDKVKDVKKRAVRKPKARRYSVRHFNPIQEQIWGDTQGF